MKHFLNLYDHPTLAAAGSVEESRARRLPFSSGVCVVIELSDDKKTVLSAEVVEQFVPSCAIVRKNKCFTCGGTGKLFIDGYWYGCGVCSRTGEVV